MERKTVFAPEAPKALGPYSHAVRAGQLLFTSGQLPMDPATGQIVAGDARVQVRRALENIRTVLRAAGADLGDVVRVGVFLANLADAKAMNEVYAEFFPASPPARTTVGAALPAGALVEIDAVAVIRG
jgi:2-iminobutanoate/2-iminopropanoate deaminase